MSHSWLKPWDAAAAKYGSRSNYPPAKEDDEDVKVKVVFVQKNAHEALDVSVVVEEADIYHSMIEQIAAEHRDQTLSGREWFEFLLPPVSQGGPPGGPDSAWRYVFSGTEFSTKKFAEIAGRKAQQASKLLQEAVDSFEFEGERRGVFLEAEGEEFKASVVERGDYLPECMGALRIMLNHSEPVWVLESDVRAVVSQLADRDLATRTRPRGEAKNTLKAHAASSGRSLLRRTELSDSRHSLKFFLGGEELEVQSAEELEKELANSLVNTDDGALVDFVQAVQSERLVPVLKSWAGLTCAIEGDPIAVTGSGFFLPGTRVEVLVSSEVAPFLFDESMQPIDDQDRKLSKEDASKILKPLTVPDDLLQTWLDGVAARSAQASGYDLDLKREVALLWGHCRAQLQVSTSNFRSALNRIPGVLGFHAYEDRVTGDKHGSFVWAEVQMETLGTSVGFDPTENMGEKVVVSHSAVALIKNEIRG